MNHRLRMLMKFTVFPLDVVRHGLDGCASVRARACSALRAKRQG